MLIRAVRTADLPSSARMRADLWPEASAADHEADAATSLGAIDHAAFVAEDPSGKVIGFAEASLRRDYVNGCDTSPVAFLEGIYVEAAHRRSSAGRASFSAVEARARERLLGARVRRVAGQPPKPRLPRSPVLRGNGARRVLPQSAVTEAEGRRRTARPAHAHG
jgi:GNAT superfamily N-acetyltransferase